MYATKIPFEHSAMHLNNRMNKFDFCSIYSLMFEKCISEPFICTFCRAVSFEKVQLGKDQEKAQSETMYVSQDRLFQNYMLYLITSHNLCYGLPDTSLCLAMTDTMRNKVSDRII